MKAKTKWVDFKELKEKVGILEILKHYGILNDLQPKNVFNCFACGAGGNVLDFVAQMEDVDIRKAGLLIQEWFNLSPARKLARKGRKPEPEPEREEAESKPEETAPEKETPDSDKAPVNPPLTFELKDLDQNHPYLKERGLEKETIKEFGIGFCKRGLMKERIAIPIYNENGELVAYAGRYPGEPPEGEPKYKLPPNKRRASR